jgi:polar amino acid transport system substrate-binding protein
VRTIVFTALTASLTLSIAAVATAAPADLDTKTPGTLLIGTDNPAFPPWFGGGEKNKPWKINDPGTGKGYESAVAYAVAKELGYKPANVKWTVVPFTRSFAPGKKPFDLFINQVSYSPARAKNVDFSVSYYNVNQAIVGLKGKPISKATTLAGLRTFKFGASIGTTSYEAITSRIKPDQKPAVFDRNEDAVKALDNGTIDGLVVDLPTAYFVTAAQVEGSKIVGQFPAQGTPERFGVVLGKGSSLTGPVNAALTRLRRNGTLKRLEQKWLAGATAPFLK